MASLIKLIILILLACFIGYFINYGQGHIIILLAKYRFDMSLATFIISIILIFILCYFLIRSWVNTTALFEKIHNYRSKYIPK